MGSLNPLRGLQGEPRWGCLGCKLSPCWWNSLIILYAIVIKRYSMIWSIQLWVTENYYLHFHNFDNSQWKRECGVELIRSLSSKIEKKWIQETVVPLLCEREQWNGCASSSFDTSTRLMRRFQWAISESPSFSISRLVYRRSLCYDYQFSFILKLELITITKIWQLDSLWKRDWGEFRRGLLYWPLASSECSYKTLEALPLAQLR